MIKEKLSFYVHEYVAFEFSLEGSKIKTSFIPEGQLTFKSIFTTFNCTKQDSSSPNLEPKFLFLVWDSQRREFTVWSPTNWN